jgi:hypothetical protein
MSEVALTSTLAPALGGQGSVLSLCRPRVAPALLETLHAIRDQTGLSPAAAVRDFASLAFGPGRMSLDAYVALRLFDHAAYEGVDRSAFLGTPRIFATMPRLNFRGDLWGLLADKVAGTNYLAAYGLPVIPIRAIFRENLAESAGGGPVRLGSPATLHAYLSDPSRYPLFAKPVEGFQSLGSVSLDAYEPGTGMLTTTDGRHMELARFVAEVVANYGRGYLFQDRVAPHEHVRLLCGERLATVRFITLQTQDGPILLRACWKLPAGGNAADNFWRSGNLLAGLDLATGRVVRAVRGKGLDQTPAPCHPDTGEMLVGSHVPNWRVLVDLALRGAALVDQMTLIGWDIAPVAGGGVIVEMNETPDLQLPQLADQRGMLADPPFVAALAAAPALARRFRRERLRTDG